LEPSSQGERRARVVGRQMGVPVTELGSSRESRIVHDLRLDADRSRTKVVVRGEDAIFDNDIDTLGKLARITSELAPRSADHLKIRIVHQ
jgi:hypothetical protein